MIDLLNQIEEAIKKNLYYIALLSSLTIPDICGALESDDGKASKEKYIVWFEKYLDPIYSKGHEEFISGEDCYYLRCSILHQGRMSHKKSKYDRIMFLEPSDFIVHNIVIKGEKESVLVIDVIQFCFDVMKALRQWLDKVKETENYKNNSNLFMKRYTNGFPPYFSKNFTVIT